MKNFKVGFVIDPIGQLNPKKDSTLAMVQAALKRGWQVYVFEMADINASPETISANAYHVHELELGPQATSLQARANPSLPAWINAEPKHIALEGLNLIMMRKDPPYTPAYHFCTQLLSLLEARGVMVSNQPRSLREFNEKLFILHFPALIAPTMVSCALKDIRAFCQQHGPVVIKPLDAMGGSGIFKVNSIKDNLGVILELLTAQSQQPVMVQKFVPQITAGDKRVLMINGEPVPHLLARIPQGDDFRGNLAAGGKGVVQPISSTERAIAKAIGPTLRQHGIHFAGLDIIGDRLTEINITSPTCIREIERETGLDISGQLMDTLHRIKLKT